MMIVRIAAFFWSFVTLVSMCALLVGVGVLCLGIIDRLLPLAALGVIAMFLCGWLESFSLEKYADAQEFRQRR